MTKDLMFQNEIKQAVSQAYAAIATGQGGGGPPVLHRRRALRGSRRGRPVGARGGQPRPVCDAAAW